MKNLNLFLVSLIVIVAISCEDDIIIPSVISFENTSDSGFEGTDYSIEINFDTPVDNQITINYTVSGTAGSNDYSLPSSLTVPSGSTSATLNLVTFDNSEYNSNGKTVIITITDVIGSDNVQFGSSTFTYTILENDLQILLSWSPNSGIAGDHDLDLFLGDEAFNLIDESICGDCTTEEIVMDGINLSNQGYIVQADYYSGLVYTNPNISVNYTVTLNFPDGSASSNGDVFTASSLSSQTYRTLFLINKNGEGNFSATINPFGPDGRQALTKLPRESK